MSCLGRGTMTIATLSFFSSIYFTSQLQPPHILPGEFLSPIPPSHPQYPPIPSLLRKGQLSYEYQ